jgi:hypothetical protein
MIFNTKSRIYYIKQTKDRAEGSTFLHSLISTKEIEVVSAHSNEAYRLVSAPLGVANELMPTESSAPVELWAPPPKS